MLSEAKANQFEGDAETGEDRTQGHQAGLGGLALATAALWTAKEARHDGNVGESNFSAISRENA
jgi:hypothetical protein